MGKRATALLLCLAMMFSTAGIASPAGGTDPAASDAPAPEATADPTGTPMPAGDPGMDVDGRPIVFVGWSDGKAELARTRNSDNAFTIYHAGDKVKIGAFDLTLYAVWTYGETPAGPTDGPAPVDPDSPSDTPAPTAPSGPSGTPAPTASGRPDTAPGTGDSAHPEIWAALFGLFSIGSDGLVLTLEKRRRSAGAAANARRSHQAKRSGSDDRT